MLEHKRLLYGKPGLYLATPEGLRWTFNERRNAYRLGPGGFQHAWELAATAVALHNALPERTQLSDREIRVGENDGPELLDLELAVRGRSVVYFRLDSDRRPLLAAIVSDLIALVAWLQADPIPTVVMIDEFSAVAAEHCLRPKSRKAPLSRAFRMRSSGLEPPRAVKPTRPSTLRVYQIPPRAQSARV